MKSIILGILLLAGLSACTGLERSPYSGYTSDYGFTKTGAQRYSMQKQQLAQDQVREELGLTSSRVLTPQEQQRLGLRLQLKQLEQQIGSTRAKEQYYKLKPYLKNDADRVRYLSIPNEEGRSHWVANRGISSQEKAYTEAIDQLIENRDIVVGMTKKAVIQSWGDPDVVEVAGNPIYSNERWQYKKYVSSSDGYAKEVRVVYFEGGLVAGWEKY